jgi:hypothetical protein
VRNVAEPVKTFVSRGKTQPRGSDTCEARPWMAARIWARSVCPGTKATSPITGTAWCSPTGTTASARKRSRLLRPGLHISSDAQNAATGANFPFLRRLATRVVVAAAAGVPTSILPA